MCNGPPSWPSICPCGAMCGALLRRAPATATRRRVACAPAIVIPYMYRAVGWEGREIESESN